MIHRASITIIHALGACAYPSGLHTNELSDGHDSIDQRASRLVNELADRAINASLRGPVPLDSATLGKVGHTATRSHGASSFTGPSANPHLRLRLARPPRAPAAVDGPDARGQSVHCLPLLNPDKARQSGSSRSVSVQAKLGRSEVALPKLAQHGFHVPRTSTRAAALAGRSSAEEDSRFILSADCGGTTTRLQLFRVSSYAELKEQDVPPGELVGEDKFPNIMFKSLEDIIERFVDKMCANTARPTIAVIAVAGVVTNNQCRFTNLDWEVDGYELADRLGFARCEIINDFVAQGYGTLTLAEHDVVNLNGIEPRFGAPCACIGAGTGLGHCFLTADPTGEYKCYPSEAGHVEFPPRGRGNDNEQVELLKHLKIKFSGWNRISVERVVSGGGICNIYEFLAFRYPDRVDPDMHYEFLQRPKDASIISNNALPGSLCDEALRIFCECYGAQCGSWAIQTMPFRGLYITGGVSKRLGMRLKEKSGSFMKAYFDKGRVSPLLDQVPLYLVKQDDMGQRGAHYRAVMLLKRHLAGKSGRTGDPRSKKHLDKSALPAPAGLREEEVIRQVRGLLSEYEDSHKIEKGDRAHDAIFKSMLWMVPPSGDPLEPADWHTEELWIAKNGNLCQDNKATGQSFVRYTAADLQKASFEPLPDSQSGRPWSFTISVPEPRTTGTALSYFATSTASGRDYWIEQLRRIDSLDNEGSAQLAGAVAANMTSTN